MKVKHYQQLFLSLLLIFVFTGSAGAQKTVDRIVATVNNDIITLSQLNRRADPLIRAQGASGEKASKIKHDVLNMMIDQMLGVQEAKKAKLYISEAEIDGAINSILKQYSINLEQMKSALLSQGTTFDLFREDIKMEILKSKVLSLQVRQKVVVTDREVASFLSGNPTTANLGQKIRMIYLPLESNNSNIVKTRLLEAANIKKEILNGLDFAKAASKYSQGPGNDRGGLSNAKFEDLDQRLKKALEDTPKGTVTEPVLLEGVVVLALLEEGKTKDDKESKTKPKRKKGKTDLTQYSQAEIDQAKEELGKAKMKDKFDDWVANVRKQSSITINL